LTSCQKKQKIVSSFVCFPQPYGLRLSYTYFSTPFIPLELKTPPFKPTALSFNSLIIPNTPPYRLLCFYIKVFFSFIYSVACLSAGWHNWIIYLLVRAPVW
jgi:hypothetical protein